MTFKCALIFYFRNYFNFSGRSSRSAYWWVFLFGFIATFSLDFTESLILGISLSEYFYEYQDTLLLSSIFSAITLIPGISLSVRRLHDVNKSGWWLLIAFTVIGIIPLFLWFCSKSEILNNNYGSNVEAGEGSNSNTALFSTLIILCISFIYLIYSNSENVALAYTFPNDLEYVDTVDIPEIKNYLDYSSENSIEGIWVCDAEETIYVAIQKDYELGENNFFEYIIEDSYPYKKGMVTAYFEEIKGNLYNVKMIITNYDNYEAEWINLTATYKDGSLRIEDSTNNDVFLYWKRYPNLSDKSAVINDNTEAFGTGFFISHDGYVLTCYHVIEDANEIIVDYKGVDYKAEYVTGSYDNDVALVKIDCEVDNFLKLETKRDIKLGDKLFTLGYPEADILGTNLKYSEGVLASASGSYDRFYQFQHTIPIQPGNSGGPILNEAGLVVGIVESYRPEMESVYYGIKSKVIDLLLPENLITKSSAIKNNKKGNLIQNASESIVFIEVK